MTAPKRGGDDAGGDGGDGGACPFMLVRSIEANVAAGDGDVE
jgi:hypothetical protein